MSSLKSPSGHIRSQDACRDGPSVRRHLDVLRADDPFRNSYNDSELRIAIGQVGGLPQNRRFT
jgi:hypothetical protein